MSRQLSHFDLAILIAYLVAIVGLGCFDFDTRRDFDAARRSFIAAPVLPLVRPVVEVSDPLVEGVLLRHPEDGRLCVTLANWAYAVTSLQEDDRGRRSPVVRHLPAHDLTLTIRGAADVRRATSCWLEKPLALQRRNDGVIIQLPHLEEGDVVLLE
jgi:hypothetical protein